MKGTIRVKFKSNQFFYTSESWKEKGEERVMVLSPLSDLWDLEEDQLGFLVDDKEGLIEGEGWIVEKSKVVEFKKKIKESYPKKRKLNIVKIKQELIKL